MALISLTCPSCGGAIQMDDTLDKGFCMYCGNQFFVKDETQRINVQHSGSINFNINREMDVENLLVRAQQKIREKEIRGLAIDYKDIKENYLEKALDIDPNSKRIQKFRKDIADNLFECANNEIKKLVDTGCRIENYYENIMLNFINIALDFDPSNKNVIILRKAMMRVLDEDRKKDKRQVTLLLIWLLFLLGLWFIFWIIFA